MTKAPDAIFPVAPGDAHGRDRPGPRRPRSRARSARRSPRRPPTSTSPCACGRCSLGAGVNVVMTRTGDTKVNRKNVDWTRDGKVAYRDELAVADRDRQRRPGRRVHRRPQQRDAAGRGRHGDLVRPDPAVRGGQQDAREPRPGQPREVPQDPGDLRAGSRSTGASTRRRSTCSAGTRPGFLERPSEMPGILGESLAMGHPYERWLLRQPRGKQAIAEGYYDGPRPVLRDPRLGRQVRPAGRPRGVGGRGHRPQSPGSG